MIASIKHDVPGYVSKAVRDPAYGFNLVEDVASDLSDVDISDEEVQVALNFLSLLPMEFQAFALSNIFRPDVSQSPAVLTQLMSEPHASWVRKVSHAVDSVHDEES